MAMGLGFLNPAGAFSYVNLDMQGGVQFDFMNAGMFNFNGLLLLYANQVGDTTTLNMTAPAPYIEAVACEWMDGRGQRRGERKHAS